MLRTPSFSEVCNRAWKSRTFSEVASVLPPSKTRAPFPADGMFRIGSRIGLSLPSACEDPLPSAVAHLKEFLSRSYGTQTSRQSHSGIILRLLSGKQAAPSESFFFHVTANRVEISSDSFNGLANGIWHLERQLALNGAPVLHPEKRKWEPRFALRLHCDVWGGYTVTPRFLRVPHRLETFLTLARHGINATQMRVRLEDVFCDRRYPELCNPLAGKRRKFIGDIVKTAKRAGIKLFLHADNFRLKFDHPFFKRHPRLRGARIFGGSICPVCTGSRQGMEIISGAWKGLFEEIPDLGGIVAIVGGECFAHCGMRPLLNEAGVSSCPRCGKKGSAEIAAGLCNEVASAIRVHAPHARVLAWPYSAETDYAWRADEAEMRKFITLLGEGCSMVLEIEKDGVQAVRGEPGASRLIKDYSISFAGPSQRFARQGKFARMAGTALCAKTETLGSWECGMVPFLPLMTNWAKRWDLLRKSPARDLHMGWPLYGFYPALPAELAAWQLWKQSPGAATVLKQLLARDWGADNIPSLLKIYTGFSRAFEMLPNHYTSYYTFVQFLGAANPLILDMRETLPREFYGFHFYQGEGGATDDGEKPSVVKLPYEDHIRYWWIHPPGDPAAIAARCVRRAEKCWGQWESLYLKIAADTNRMRFLETKIVIYLGSMLRTYANLEEFYALRRKYQALNKHYYFKTSRWKPYRAVCLKMKEIAGSELVNAKRCWKTIRGDERFDLSLRLETPTLPIAELYEAKFRHTRRLIQRLADEAERSGGFPAPVLAF